MVCKWADDSQRFILEHFDVICDSPSGVYHYALPFSPSSSWIREYYSLGLSQEVRVVKGLQAKWGTCFRTVSFDHDTPQALACWKNQIAVRFVSGEIIILNAITGIHLSVLSNHTHGVNNEVDGGVDDEIEVDVEMDEADDEVDVEMDEVDNGIDDEMEDVHSGADDTSDEEEDFSDGIDDASDGVNNLAFSPDGTFLVSGSDDNTLKLWDIQTGGVVKIFYGHTEPVLAVSISPNCTMIASGSRDHTIRLWDAETAKCHRVIEGHSNGVYTVSFFPRNPQLFISASSDNTIQQWNINGHRIGPTYEGNSVTFSSDGTHFVLWKFDESIATVHSSGSGEVITELQSPGGGFRHCCFSADGRFIAGGVGNSVYIWDITSSDPYLIETFIGHTDKILTLVFSSSFISSSEDNTIKFWQAGVSSMNPVTVDSESTSLTLASIHSVSLQATEGIAISSDSAGVVKTWDVSTGLCKESFETEIEPSTWRDIQLIDGMLTFVWFDGHKIHICDIGRGELQQLDAECTDQVKDLRISGDMSKVFLLSEKSIRAWSIGVGETVGEVELEDIPLFDSLVVDGSRVWVYSVDLQTQGWDFGFPGSTPIPLYNLPPGGHHLHFIGTEFQEISPSRVTDIVTGKEVLRLSGRYAKPYQAKLDGQYLVAGYRSGEVLILDLSHILLQ